MDWDGVICWTNDCVWIVGRWIIFIGWVVNAFFESINELGKIFFKICWFVCSSVLEALIIFWLIEEFDWISFFNIFGVFIGSFAVLLSKKDSSKALGKL